MFNASNKQNQGLYMTHLTYNDRTNAEEYIIRTFQHCNIIGLGEGGHHLENAHQFFHQLFENKKFQEIVDVVILEFANTDYQNILDEYIYGKEVDVNELQKLWRESTQSATLFGEANIYFELLKKIREINFALPKDKKIRVLGGDPSINWASINNIEDWKNQVGYEREILPATLAKEFGINQKKKVLLIYSEFHLTKIPDKIFDEQMQTITSIINKTLKDSMKVIGISYSESLLSHKQFKDVPLYSAVDLSDNELGNVPASQFFQASVYKDNKEIILFDKYKLKDTFDALIYVGSYSSLKKCLMPQINQFDKNSLQELNRRRTILGLEPLAYEGS